MALHDPARVLREIEAERRILARASSVRQRAARSCRGTTAATAGSTAPLAMRRHARPRLALRRSP
ncbi:DUF6221 family protein [Streptomyces sp. NPDC005065]|uniref:DUF6221 family protein n=1 Tax=Streptomyces sp. NPDC005065 TaxID=3154461 RepID=UPI0033B8C11A